MTDLHCQVAVVGGGPGGYATAIRAGQLGLDAILIEADALGGTCLNVGCIPSKALLHVADRFSAVRAGTGEQGPADGVRVAGATLDLAQTRAWIQGTVTSLGSGIGALLRKAGVRRVAGWAQVLDGKTVSVGTPDGELCVRAEHLVLATGSRAAELPSLPFGGRVISSTQALERTEVPARLAVVGGGYIGLELGTAFAKLGAAVTVVEAGPSLLPTFDPDLVAPVSKRLGDLGVRVLTGARAEGLRSATGPLLVRTEEGVEEIEADLFLVAVGRSPATEGWGLEGLDLDREGPFVRVDGGGRTSMRGVYAVGDLTGDPMLAHRAIAQGEVVAEVIAGHARAWDDAVIPAVVFTDPEIVVVGLTARAVGEGDTQVVEGTFPFLANGRAGTAGDRDGFVRVLARADDHVVVGLSAVGAGVSELSGELVLALEMGARLEDLAGTVHAHPTRSEAVQEAARHALGSPLHR